MIRQSLKHRLRMIGSNRGKLYCMGSVRNCYVHIPFCKKICSYCDFCKLFYDRKYVSQYLDSLQLEIATYYQGEELDTIYIGGGTPSSLSDSELEKLFSILSVLKKSSSCEVTIEANFDSITESKLDICKKYGVNRISFGLESTHAWILEKMGRSLDLDYVRHIIAYCKKIGICNINVDLMYAFLGESLEEVEEDINFIQNLDVPHISTYSLILEEHTKLYLDKEQSISEELDAKMYEVICSKLSDYTHYEISNFCKEGYSSRHNLCYWQNREYYGFGLGASGYLGDIRYTNTRSITHYLQKKFRYLEENLSIYDKMEYEVILNLRTKKGISKKNFFDKYSMKLEDCYSYLELVREGYLIEDDEYLAIPEKYFYLSNEILVRLLEECCYE